MTFLDPKFAIPQTEQAFKNQVKSLSHRGLMNGHLIVENHALQQTHILRFIMEYVKKFLGLENHINEPLIQYQTLKLLLDNKQFLHLPECSPFVQNLAKRVRLTYTPKNAPTELKELIQDISCELLLNNEEERADRQKDASDLLNRFSQYYHLPVEIQDIDTVFHQTLLTESPFVSSTNPHIESTETTAENPATEDLIEEAELEFEDEEIPYSEEDFYFQEIPSTTIHAKKLTREEGPTKLWKTAAITLAALGALTTFAWYMRSPSGFDPKTMCPLIPTSSDINPSVNSNTWVNATTWVPDSFFHVKNFKDLTPKIPSNTNAIADVNLLSLLIPISISLAITTVAACCAETRKKDEVKNDEVKNDEVVDVHVDDVDDVDTDGKPKGDIKGELNNDFFEALLNEVVNANVNAVVDDVDPDNLEE